MSIPARTLIDWLSSITAIDPSWATNDGPYIPDMPDRLITVTVVDGAGYLTEEASLDQPFFQLRVRGAQDSREDAEAQAFALDSAIRKQRFPQQFGGYTISLVVRNAGAPATLGPPEAGSMRYEYVCTYRIVAGVN